jgi:hypothetical protein
LAALLALGHIPEASDHRSTYIAKLREKVTKIADEEVLKRTAVTLV